MVYAVHVDFDRCDRLAVARLQVRSALCDDLNTPQVVSALSGPLKALNDLLHTKKVSRDCI
jgi:cysteinyl-tRNA synthetase